VLPLWGQLLILWGVAMLITGNAMLQQRVKWDWQVCVPTCVIMFIILGLAYLLFLKFI